MGFSRNSHGKRSDKETQSPMLKIFKDMMHKEKSSDPEKTNLLKDKNVDRKRKHYSGLRTKSGHITISSSSDRHKHKQPYNIADQETRKAEFDNIRSNSHHFQNEKRESWWFMKDKDKDNKSKADETCSCVSCAFKKILGSDYACVTCLIVLFTVSVIIAIMMIYTSGPNCTKPVSRTCNKNGSLKDTERLKRKIDGLGRNWNFGSKNSWANAFSRSRDPGFSSFKFQDMSFADSESDLSRILDADKINDIQNSERLKDFYRKLVQTDAAIRNLRKSFNDNAYSNINNFDYNKNFDLYNNIDMNSNIDLNSNFDLNSNNDFDSKVDLKSLDKKKRSLDKYDRMKRSLRMFHKPMRLFHFKRNDNRTKSRIDNGKVITSATVNMTHKKPNKQYRDKRFGNFNDTEGFVIEKNRVMIKYLPGLNRDESTLPNDIKFYDSQMQEPFYKNNQKVDELLERVIDKKLPFRFEIDTMPEKNTKFKQPLNEEIIIVKEDDPNSEKDKEDLIPKEFEKDTAEEQKIENRHTLGKTESNSFENEFFDDSEGVFKTEKERSSTSSYDILLSVSTLINPTVKRTLSYPVSVLVDRVPNLRKLMQADVKEDEGVAYEDLKEVLTDDKEGHDDNDKGGDRKKRDDEPQPQTTDSNMKHYPINVHNLNWKGPMPLYPDELVQTMKQSQEPNNKVEIPVLNQDTYVTDETKPGLTDVEYVEDYLDNGYERLVELAQAYSDYGVLDEKKDADTGRKIDDKSEHKLKDRKARISVHGFKSGIQRGLRKSGIFGRSSKENQDNSEGIRIEFQPTLKSDASNDYKDNLYKMLSKHVKIANFKNKDSKIDKGKKDAYAHTPTKEKSSIHLHNFPSTPRDEDDESDKNKISSRSYEFQNRPNYTVNMKNTLKSIDFKNNIENFSGMTTEALDKNLVNYEVITKFKRDTNDTLSKEAKENRETKAKDANVNDVILNRRVVNDTKATAVKKLVDKSHSSENMTMSDFFMLLSKWFSALDNGQVTSRKPISLTDIPKGQRVIIEKRYNDTGATESNFPLYDSDMIENIGHRSRVLLSIEDSNNTKAADDVSKSEANIEELNTEASSSTESMKTGNITNSTESTKLLKEEITNSNNSNRKVKRQAIDDSNLIFWNDLYDEEYGVQAEPLQNNIRDKHSIDKSDFLTKSNTWFQDKVRKFTRKLSKKDEKRSRDADGLKIVKRNIGEDDEELGSNSKVDFAALTKKMKEVCKRTVKAVQQTKNIEVKDDKESHVASSLMQQLVRLMTDLVDFQVHERTCRTLPPDLKDFLAWLTTSKKEDQVNSEPYSFEANAEHNEISFDKSTEQDLLQPSERENTDSKTDCLGTLHAVENLMQQYDNMSDDDKSVMTGVKDYLKNQMNYLQKHLSSIDGKPYSRDASRFRRSVITDVGHTVADTIEVTAHTVDREYNNFRHFYHKYMNKIKCLTKPPCKPIHNLKYKETTEANEATSKTKKLHPLKHKKTYKDKSKVTEKMKRYNDRATHIGYRDRIFMKDKSRSSSKANLKQKDRQARGKDNRFKGNDRQAEDNSDEYVNEEDSVWGKDRRNIKDVYYKAVEDAKKTSSMRSSFDRGDDFFNNGSK